MNRLLSWACLGVVCVLPALCEAAGLVRSENFIVSASNDETAQAVLNRAEELRREIAIRWLGEELPPSVGPTIIHVEISETEDSNLTWVIDDPRRSHHTMWLKTTAEQVTGGALAHELTHTILAIRFPDQIPVWANEGIACQQDDEGHKAIRQRILDWYVKTGNWPSLEKLLSKKQIPSSDHASYAIAESVVKYLLTRGDRAKLLACIARSNKRGWPTAIREEYQLDSIEELEGAWRDWVRNPKAAPESKVSRR